jgi:hypothetical protein
MFIDKRYVMSNDEEEQSKLEDEFEEYLIQDIKDTEDEDEDETMSEDYG